MATEKKVAPDAGAYELVALVAGSLAEDDKPAYAYRLGRIAGDNTKGVRVREAAMQLARRMNRRITRNGEHLDG